tara:strand:- start:447 stop:1694 length:1248 start_codon:yes stop_codon:yes gene_type:complete
MTTPSELSLQAQNSIIEEYQDGALASELALYWKVNEGTLTSWLSRRGVRRIDIGRQVEIDAELETYRARASRFQRLYKEAVKKIHVQDSLTATLEDSIKPLPVLQPLPVPTPSSSAKGSHTVVAMLSDLHAGEVVNKEAMGGLSEYNMEIFRQRVGLWVEKVLALVDIRRSRLDIPKLQILADGDFVSGSIHDELERTNEVNIMDQCSTTALVMAHAIAQVSQHFESVEISCTVGNHGRMKQKKEMKEASVSWDYMCYQLMAGWLKNFGHITFDIPKSRFAVTPIEQMKFLHWHGDGIKSWNGIPWYGITRAVKSVREALQVGDIQFDGVAMGHFHVPHEYMMPTGPLLINGNWKGGDEYALDGLNTIIKPYQTLFYVHSEYGYVGSELIHLVDADKSHAQALPKLNAVWLENEL